MATYERDCLEEISEKIAGLTYGDLRELGRRLHDMATDREEFQGAAKLSAIGFSELLSDWSALTEQDIAAAAQPES